MIKIEHRLKIYLGLFLMVTTVGTFAFMSLEKLSFADALYYNIVTMSTVGYGDIHPSSGLSRLVAVLIIVAGGAAFLGVIANATELVILKHDRQNRMRKINMVLGVFFSEVGNRLLSLFAQNDPDVKLFQDALMIKSNWNTGSFADARKALSSAKLRVDSTHMDLEELHKFLKGKRKFFVDLLENPILIEHEGFSETVLAVFHLQDELGSRDDFISLPKTDQQHLTGDMNRAYRHIADQWLAYLEHLKSQYPYIFSLAIRKNPFNPEASPVVEE